MAPVDFEKEPDPYRGGKRADNAARLAAENLEETVARRTADIQLIQDVAVIANEATSMESAFHAALDRIRGHLGWPVGHAFLEDLDRPGTFLDTGIWSLDDQTRFSRFVEATERIAFTPCEGTVGAVAEAREPRWIADAEALLRGNGAEDLGVKTGVAFPVLVGDKAVAVLEFFTPEPADEDKGLLEVMRHTGLQLGRVVERQRREQEIIDAVTRRQNQFGQELHDGLCQELAGISMMADSLAKKLAADGAPAAANLASLSAEIQRAKEHAGRLSKAMFSVDIDVEALGYALQGLAANVNMLHGVECTAEIGKSVAIASNQVADQLFRIAQEAVRNAVAHGKPRRIDIAVEGDGSSVTLRIRDDGTGVNLEQLRESRGLGLRIMRQRCRTIGGSLDVRPAAGGGCVVVCRVVTKRSGGIQEA